MIKRQLTRHGARARPIRVPSLRRRRAQQSSPHLSSSLQLAYLNRSPLSLSRIAGLNSPLPMFAGYNADLDTKIPHFGGA